MVGQGYDVYAVDWGTPGPVEQRMTWDDLFTRFLKKAGS